MELAVNLAWVLLALVHAAPAAVLFAPATLRRLYGVEPDGELGLLMRHRGALFLALVLLCVFAVVDPGVRRAAGLVVAVSVIAFLALYTGAGLRPGPLRNIAIVDALAMPPLLLVLYDAWLAA